MSLIAKSVTFDIGGGRMVTLETGKMARQADGSVVVSQGNCVILATVVANKEPREGQSFFPLSVDYQEKFASAGRVPGSFFKREARLNDYEVLTDAGKVTAEVAKALALKEYEKFRVIQDQFFVSDFDIEIKKLKG